MEKEIKYCSQCGNKSSVMAKFCKACGHNYVDSETKVNEKKNQLKQESHQPTKVKSKTKNKIIFLIVAVILLIGSGFYFSKDTLAIAGEYQPSDDTSYGDDKVVVKISNDSLMTLSSDYGSDEHYIIEAMLTNENNSNYYEIDTNENLR